MGRDARFGRPDYDLRLPGPPQEPTLVFRARAGDEQFLAADAAGQGGGRIEIFPLAGGPIHLADADIAIHLLVRFRRADVLGRLAGQGVADQPQAIGGPLAGLVPLGDDAFGEVAILCQSGALEEQCPRFDHHAGGQPVPGLPAQIGNPRLLPAHLAAEAVQFPTGRGQGRLIAGQIVISHQAQDHALAGPNIVGAHQSRLAGKGTDVAVRPLRGDQLLYRPVQQPTMFGGGLVGITPGQRGEPFAPVIAAPLVVHTVSLVPERFDEPVEVPGGDEVLHAVGHPPAEFAAEMDLARRQAGLHVHDCRGGSGALSFDAAYGRPRRQHSPDRQRHRCDTLGEIDHVWLLPQEDSQ